jgi:ATP dependent DNA ligase domain
MTTWRPMLATAATVLPTGAEWTYEVKWDGYRVIAVKDGARVQILSRNAKDLTRDYPTVVAAIAQLEAAHVVLDGELVAVDAHGKPSFQALQHRATSDLALVYYAFDLLALNREPWTRSRTSPCSNGRRTGTSATFHRLNMCLGSARNSLLDNGNTCTISMPCRLTGSPWNTNTSSSTVER